MDIILFEAYYGGSHKNWADQLKHHSKHNIEIISLPARHWKWRMEGAAIAFANMLPGSYKKPDLIIGTSMLDLTYLKANLPYSWSDVPSMYYMHENQFTYPQSQKDTDVKESRDFHYGMIQFKSMLSAYITCFNSDYQKNIFFHKLKDLLNRLPDYAPLEEMELLASKAMTLHVGIQESRRERKENKVPVILWNHRWEYDKNPEVFFQSLFNLKQLEIDFELIVVGGKGRTYPPIFDEAKIKLAKHIKHWSYVETNEAYLELINQSDIMLITSNQEFFGIAVLEAVLCGVIPLFPNRLVYPEHFSPESHNDLFYDDDSEIVDKLINLINKPPQESVKKELITKAKQYLWHEQIQRYDLIFESIVFE